jgi:hypothetical protein
MGATSKGKGKTGAGIKRRDGAGHLDKAYSADLRRKSRESAGPRTDGEAFIHGARTNDDLAEQLAEEFVEAATTGEAEGEDVLNQLVPEERGGPFVVTTAGTEFAEGTDASNPKGSKREPFPRT